MLAMVCTEPLLAEVHQEVYKTEPKIEEIKTLRTIVDEDFRKLPVIDLQGNSHVNISFDYLADEQAWLTYRIIHCDAEWKEDNMGELDYMSSNGFWPMRMEQVQASFNTITSTYYHYEVSFPNEDVTFLISGNYAVLFAEEEDPDNVVAVATFSVSEQEAFVRGEVSGNTDIDYLQRHQQVNLAVNWSNQKFPYMNAADELTLVVRQNHRDDMKRVVKKPMRMENGSAYYEHNRDLIFEGGNTWRQFENNDERYPGIGIDKLRFTQQGYDVWLMTDASRAHREYFTEQDEHGRYLVHAVKVDDIDTESEYSWVHFSLKASAALDEAGIYLMGDFTYGNRTPEFRMEYDPQQELYVKKIYLKQGAYNYMYSTSAVEGNHYETGNEYDVYIYYRPFGAFYDRLLGVGVIKK